MAVMDEFKEEREQVKKRPLKERLEYFWFYYKWYVLGGILAVFVVTTLIRDIAGSREDALYAVVVNAYITENEPALAEGFAEYAGIDTSKYGVSIHSSVFINDQMDETSITSGQLITVYIAAGDLDIGIMDPTQYTKYAYSGIFQDLREYLDASFLESLSDKLYYIDYAVLEKLEAGRRDNLSTSDIVLPDPFCPETMEDPRPVGINLHGCERFFQSYTYEDDLACVGTTPGSESPDMAARFLQYLFTNEE